MPRKNNDTKDRKQIWIYPSAETTVDYWSEIMGISKKLAASVLIEIGNEAAKDDPNRFLETIRRFSRRGN